jgi:hypothetical protein
MNTTSARNNLIEATDRKTALLVGLLFLSSTFSFAIGNTMIAGYFAGTNSAISGLLAGVLLQAYTALAVAAIGIAMLPLLKPYHQPLALAYLGLRVLECLAILGVGIYMLAVRQQLQHYDLLIYAFTSTGGMVFSYLLYRASMIPRPLAALGLFGYVVLLLSIPTVLLGLADLNSGWGMVFFVPGGLFELILPFLLFVSGFRLTKN